MQYCRKYCLLSWKCIVSLFVFLLSQILHKEKINRNLQDFQRVTKIPHNKKHFKNYYLWSGVCSPSQ